MAEMVLLRTTVPNEAAATDLARRLIEEQFACCVHRFPIQSTYSWEGKVEDATEWLIEARVPPPGVDAVWEAMLDGHPDDTPLVEVLPGSQVPARYAAWAESVTKSP